MPGFCGGHGRFTVSVIMMNNSAPDRHRLHHILMVIKPVDLNLIHEQKSV